MTTHEYIRQRFGKFGIDLSNADLLDLYDEVEYTSDISREVQIKMVQFIPELLLMPNVSENGISFSWDRDGLRDYYNLKCKEYGLRNELQPKVRFL